MNRAPLNKDIDINEIDSILGDKNSDATVHHQINEDSIALEFAKQNASKLRYDHDRRQWFEWDGARWREEKTDLAFDYARNLCREYNKYGQYTALPKYRTANAVERFARADRRIAVENKVWDKNKSLLCTPTGTVELLTGNRRDNLQSDLITKRVPITPVKMTIPLWTRFLDEITQGDTELQKYLCLLAGYCLTGSIREHALFHIYGPGGNGKSIFMSVLSEVMGDYAITAAMSTFTASKWDAHPTELARLQGARLVIANETEANRKWAESRIKNLTGGDIVSARYMHKDFFQYTPQFKLIFVGNHKPTIDNVDDAIRRRFQIIPFTFKPDVPDKTLQNKLKKEYPGILQWALEGCLEWQQSGLIIPDIVKQETESYFVEQDLFSQWLAECTQVCPTTTGETTLKLFHSWSQWALDQGETVGSTRGFTDKMKHKRFDSKRHTPGYRGRRGFIGIQLRNRIAEI